MDHKKISRLLAGEKRPETVRLTLNIEKGIYEAATARWPKNSQPSLSKVVETLLSEYMEATKRK